MALIQPVEDGKIIETTTNANKTEENGNEMGYDQFLQLLCAEMQYQDPLEPTTNTEYVAQLATFSQMESTLAMQSTIESSNANSLVGEYVIIKTTSATGATYTTEGFVDYVQKENGEQYVCVNGSLYSLSDVYQVADPEYMEAMIVANAFNDQVAKLPNPSQLTLADQEDVENLTKVYEAMSSYQRTFITSDALEKYKELVARMAELTGNNSDGSESDVPDTDTDTGETGSTDTTN